MRNIFISNSRVFIIGEQELKGKRIDVSFHRPEFKLILKNIAFKIKLLKDILCEPLKNGSTPSGGKFLCEGIPFIRSQDYDIKRIQINQFISIDFHRKLKRSIIVQGDILLSVVGATLGNVGIVRDELKEGNINQNIVRIRIKDNINAFYVAYFLYSNIGQKLLSRASTITTQKYLNNETLEKLPIPLPSHDIQNKIVQIMDKAMKKKEDMEKKANILLNSIDIYLLRELGIILEEFKEKSLLTYIVRNRILLNKRWDVEYWKPEYREAEKVIKRGRYRAEPLSRFIKEINYGASLRNIYAEDGIPLIRILNLKQNEIDLSDLVKVPFNFQKEIGNSYVQKGDFLISRSGTIGVVAIVPKEAEGYAFGSYMIRFKLKNSKVNKYYLSIVLNSVIGRIQTQRNKIGAIQNNITIPIIEDLAIPLPPKLVQDNIADEVKSRIEKAKQLKENSKKVIESAKENIDKIILGK